MTKILLLSDTHGFLDNHIMKYVAWADEVWHAGDFGGNNIAENIADIKKLRAVYGNIDDPKMRNQYPLDDFFELEGFKVWITHIGGFPGKYEKRVQSKLLTTKVDIFICGHSHILKIIYDNKNRLLHLNPGAAGMYGFHNIRTMIRFQLDNGKIENMEIIEIEKK